MRSLKCTILLLTFFLVGLLGYSGGVQIVGVVVNDSTGFPIQEGAVEVFDKAGELVNSTTTDGFGRYALVLDLDQQFKIVYSAEGFYQKSISINTKVLDDKESRSLVYKVSSNLGLVEEVEGVVIPIVNFVKLNYNRFTGKFEAEVGYIKHASYKFKRYYQSGLKAIEEEEERNRRAENIQRIKTENSL